MVRLWYAFDELMLLSTLAGLYLGTRLHRVVRSSTQARVGSSATTFCGCASCSALSCGRC